jgi:hypothetical protein
MLSDPLQITALTVIAAIFGVKRKEGVLGQFLQ